MGLESTGVIAPPAKGIVDPRTGKLAGADAAFFTGLNGELADRGFLVTSAHDLIIWARTGSLMWMTFGLACCAIEMMQMAMPRYDAERFGFAPRPPPRRCSTASCCCRARSAASARSSADGLRPMDETLEKLGEAIADALPGSVTGYRVAHGELTVAATPRDIVNVATFLRDDDRCQFCSIIDITAVDWPGRERRFD